MKKQRIILLMFLLFISFSLNVSAVGDRSYYFIDAKIEENGDMLVKELVVLTGHYNGFGFQKRYRTDSMIPFTGQKSDFEGNGDIYNASGITLLKIYDVTPSDSWSFEDINRLDTKYREVARGYASAGDYNVYEKEVVSNGIDIKIFNPSTRGQRGFYIEYLIKDAVVLHEDVAELFWPFIDAGFSESIDYVEIRVNLPGAATDLRGWAHGNYNGLITIDGNNKVIAKIENYQAYTLTDIRMTFDTDLVPHATKLSKVNAFNHILDIEQEKADAANKKREIARTIYYGVTAINFIWCIGAIALVIYTYKKYDKEHKSSFNLEYHREFPASYGPEIVEYLMKKNITTSSLSAMILNIVSKRV